MFSAAWLSYKNAPSFDLEKWCIYVILAIVIGMLMPLRFFNAAGYSVFVAGLIYLFLVLTNQSLVSTARMQAGVAVALLIFCAVAYFREQQLWLLFQSRGWEQRHNRA
jgi:cell shape-determining protein MreD